MERIAGALAEAATEMGEQPTLRATLDTICAHALTGLRADGCGIFLVRGRRPEVAAMDGDGIAEVERAQLELDEGPCLDTIWDADSMLVDDLRDDGRWPRWRSRMVELGWLSALSLQLLEGGRTVGSLNLFAHAAGAFTRADVEVASLFARHASLALASSRTRSSLTEAVDARHRVGLAQGILIERYGLSLDDSFALLKRFSQDGNVKIHEIATRLIETGQLPGLPPPSTAGR